VLLLNTESCRYKNIIQASNEGTVEPQSYGTGFRNSETSITLKLSVISMFYPISSMNNESMQLRTLQVTWSANY